MSPPKKLLGVFGGLFDPIHLGHVTIINQIQPLIDFKHIYYVPCHIPNHKPASNASGIDRVAMINLAIKHQHHCSVNDYELDNKTTSYSYNTLKYLRNTDTNLAFIMSSEAFQFFTSWHRWQDILKLAHLIVVNRDQLSFDQLSQSLLSDSITHDINELYHQQSGKIFPISIQSLDISSSQVRNAIKNREDTLKYLDPAVINYIKQHQLYQSVEKHDND